MPSKIIFTEEFCQPENLHPFTLTRRIQDIRVGILTIREKWERMLDLPSFDKKEDDYKDSPNAMNLTEAASDGSCFMIHGNVLPTPSLVKAVLKLKNGEFLSANGDEGIVFRFSKAEMMEEHKVRINKAVEFNEEILRLQFPWHICQLNDGAIRQDFQLLTTARKSEKLSETNRITNPASVFVEEGVKMEHCILNASNGAIYIGKHAEIMEGSMIRGPVSIGEGSVIKMGTKMYGATTVGPHCIVGGEIKNSVLFGCSNKAHDGYLGDSVIGEWCNLGAGTSNSNLKNNAGEVRIWTQKGKINAGNKCGVLMGDYSRTAINTSLNTGTVIGACCNVFGAGLTPKYIPSFSWGTNGIDRYGMEKAMVDIAAWKQMKGRTLGEREGIILKHIFDSF